MATSTEPTAPRPTITEHNFPEPGLLGEALYARCYANVDGLECALCREGIGWYSGDYNDPGGWKPIWELNAGGDVESTLLCEDCMGWLDTFGFGSAVSDVT